MISVSVMIRTKGGESALWFVSLWRMRHCGDAPSLPLTPPLPFPPSPSLTLALLSFALSLSLALSLSHSLSLWLAFRASYR